MKKLCVLLNELRNKMKKLRVLLLLPLLLLLGCGTEKAGELSEEPSPTPFVGTIEEQTVDESCTELSLKGTASIEELREILENFPGIKKVSFSVLPYETKEAAALVKDFPAVFFQWPLSYGKTRFISGERELDFSEEKKNVEALCELIPLSPGTEKVELGDQSISIKEAKALREAAPGVLFRYNTELLGHSVSTSDTEIDLSGVELDDTVELESELIRFPKLEKLILSDCGLDDDTLDALNNKYSDIRVVWTVQIYDRGIRTDQDYYIHYNCERYFPKNNGNCRALRYCPDLIAVDVGHFYPTNEDLEFLYYTPHMKYLIIIEGYYTDITPLGSLKELEYLEMFSSPCKDLSPLLDCPNLQHLNISRCTALDESCIDVLCKMKQLKRLWFCGTYLSPEFEEVLTEALPDTEIHYVTYSNGIAPYSMDFNWRKDESYYAMRDALHMYYMDNRM